MEWKKFPENYLDVVIELHKERLSNVYRWNTNDTKTHELADLEFLNGVIKSIELSFSSKKKFSSIKEHISWIKETIEKSKIEDIEYNAVGGIYRGNVYRLAISGEYRALYWFIKIASVFKKNRIISDWWHYSDC